MLCQSEQVWISRASNAYGHHASRLGAFGPHLVSYGMNWVYMGYQASVGWEQTAFAASG